jgi:hypothetical protein
MARVVLALIWIAAAGTVGTLGYIGYGITKDGPMKRKAATIERLPARQQHNPWARWSITEHKSAHHVLIAHVETEFLVEAKAIAQQIAEPIKADYAEVLIYFHRPGRPDTVAPRRVQWSPRTGYVESVYE